jgi:hypothetical protein
MATRLKSRPLPTQNGAQARRPQVGKASDQQQERPLSLDEALYNHLALPPHLPHRQDPSLNDIENALTDRLLASVKQLHNLPNNEHSASVWESIRRGLDTTKGIHIGGHVDRTALARELNDLGHSDFLVVYARSQNCALYIRRSQEYVAPKAQSQSFPTLLTFQTVPYLAPLSSLRLSRLQLATKIF